MQSTFADVKVKSTDFIFQNYIIQQNNLLLNDVVKWGCCLNLQPPEASDKKAHVVQ